MLSGRPPYRADTAAALLLEHLHAALPELPDPLPEGTPLDPALRALHRALLDKSPAQRPSSANEVAKRMSALARAAPRPPPSTEDQAGAPPPRASPADEDADTKIRTAVDRPAPRRRSAAVLGVALFLVVIGLGVYLTWGST
jgi:serine/threonine-protein kinase